MCVPCSSTQVIDIYQSPSPDLRPFCHHLNNTHIFRRTEHGIRIRTQTRKTTSNKNTKIHSCHPVSLYFGIAIMLFIVSCVKKKLYHFLFQEIWSSTISFGCHQLDVEMTSNRRIICLTYRCNKGFTRNYFLILRHWFACDLFNCALKKYFV